MWNSDSDLMSDSSNYHQAFVINNNESLPL